MIIALTLIIYAITIIQDLYKYKQFYYKNVIWLKNMLDNLWYFAQMKYDESKTEQ